MNRTALKLVAVVSAIGAFLSGLLLSHHFDFLSGQLEGKSICAINEWIDCDAVNASSYSEFAGVPIAAFSLLFYLILIAYSLGGLAVAPNRKGGMTFCFFLNLGSFAATLWMAYISFFVLEVFCLWCGGIYLVNLFLLFLLPRALGVSWGGLGKYLADYFKSVFGGTETGGFSPRLFLHGAIFVALFAVTWFLFSQVTRAMTREDKIDVAQFIAKFAAEESQKVDPSVLPVWGNPQAKVTIIDFSDFECPFCKRAAFYLKPLLTEYRRHVAFHVGNYPLDSSCNPNMERPMHPHACNAARGAICADSKGKFWPFHDLLFENQRKLNLKYLIAYAEAVGLEREWFMKCLESPETAQALARQVELGKTLGVSGTPSIFVNGKRLGPWTSKAVLRGVIEEEIRKTKPGWVGAKPKAREPVEVKPMEEKNHE